MLEMGTARGKNNMTVGNAPLIGLTTSWTDGSGSAVHTIADAYVKAVYMAGGMPLPIPCLPENAVAELLSHLDGLVLTGGADVDPAHFGDLPWPGLGAICPQRDALELPLARSAMDLGLPILAICRGMQVLNVAAGGTLYQDLYSEFPGVLKHQQKAPRWYPTHPVEVTADTLLHRLSGRSTIWVNSFHHQAIRDLAPGFIVSGRSPDGVIEAIEYPSAGFVVGVQWHPEAMVSSEATAGRLFETLVEEAKTRRRSR